MLKKRDDGNAREIAQIDSALRALEQGRISVAPAAAEVCASAVGVTKRLGGDAISFDRIGGPGSLADRPTFGCRAGDLCLSDLFRQEA